MMEPPDLPPMPEPPPADAMPSSDMAAPPADQPAPGRGPRKDTLIAIAVTVVAALVVLALVLTTINKDGTDTAVNGAPASPGTSPAASPAPLTKTWTGNGVMIELAAGWTAGPGTDELPDALKQALAAQPAFGDVLRLGGQAAGPQFLMVLAAPKTPGMPASALTDQLIAGLTGATKAEITSRSETTVAGHPATRIEFSGASSIVGVLTFTWEDGTDDWVAMWMAPGTELARSGATYDASMRTLKITGGR